MEFQDNSCIQKLTTFFLSLWAFIKTWQFFYLSLFFIAQIITLAANPSNRAVLYLPLVILFIAYAIKLGILIFKHKIKLNPFLKMQLSFITPYILMLVYAVFSSYAVKSLNSISSMSETDSIHLVEFGTANILISIVATLICSLIINKKTTKFELFMILGIIIMETMSSLKGNVNLIQDLNGLSDQVDEYKSLAMYEYVKEKITPEKYQYVYSVMTQVGAALQNTKDYILAAIATHISQLTIMIDLIFRPMEQLEQQSEIQEGLLKNLSIQNKNKEIQLNQDLEKTQKL